MTYDPPIEPPGASEAAMAEQPKHEFVTRGFRSLGSEYCVACGKPRADTHHFQRGEPRSLRAAQHQHTQSARLAGWSGSRRAALARRHWLRENGLIGWNPWGGNEFA